MLSFKSLFTGDAMYYVITENAANWLLRFFSNVNRCSIKSYKEPFALAKTGNLSKFGLPLKHEMFCYNYSWYALFSVYVILPLY